MATPWEVKVIRAIPRAKFRLKYTYKSICYI